MGSRLFGKFFQIYNHLLNKHKYPVQIVTGGALWFTGDIICQSLVQTAEIINERRNIIENSSSSRLTSNSKEAKRRSNGLELDWMRVGRMTCYGLFVSAPVYAFWYSYLDRWSHRFFARRALSPTSTDAVILPASIRHFLQKSPARLGESLRTPLMWLASRMPEAATRRVWEIIGFKLAADCFLFDPAYLALFFTATNAMEGRSVPEISSKLRTDLLPTYLVDIAVWLPIQTVNFRWIPVVYQAIFVQSCNIGWNAYLSFVQHRDH